MCYHKVYSEQNLYGITIIIASIQAPNAIYYWFSPSLQPQKLLNSKDRHVQNVRVPSLNQGPQKFKARDAPFPFHKEVFYTFT